MVSKIFKKRLDKMKLSRIRGVACRSPIAVRAQGP
jgi:hypothetical protein